MCKNATATAAALLEAIEPTLTSLLTYTGLGSTPNGEAAIAAYNAAVAALKAWQSGTVAQNVLQLIGDFQTVFNSLPLPPTVIDLTNIILAGIQAVIGVIIANSPAPVAPAGSTASPEEITAAHQAAVAHDTEQKVAALVPHFKRSIFHSPAVQYKNLWNNTVDKDKLPATLKVA
jgi:hypothetical protein